MSSGPEDAARVAVVGGGARGIGAAVARRLAARGPVVVLDALGGETVGYRHAADIDAQALRDSGIEVRSVDLRDLAATCAAVDEVTARYGRLDVAVACASAIAGGSPLWETSSDLRDGLWAADATTAWNLASATVPHLLARPAADRPTVCVATSVAGDRGLYGLSAYVVAKHAAVGVVRALAADLVGTSVTACGVAPGATDTEMLAATARIYGLDDVHELAQHQHPPRPFDPDDVAAVIEFGCTAGTSVHGAILPADGGFGRA
ncbi:mycofactocin-coupled SDR family oxidoreductase [Phycicoccus avicenniae]|uniref:mycofactocin-coupled SDR family oxidoreductase n=1 Tax=Phycicoccus avicenniae TaxID=2828860 RepID=UPI003D2B64D0